MQRIGEFQPGVQNLRQKVYVSRRLRRWARFTGYSFLRASLIALPPGIVFLTLCFLGPHFGWW